MINIKKNLNKLLFSSFLVCVFILTSINSSFALTTESFSASPSNTNDAWLKYNLAPGESIEDSITISNNQSTSQSFYIYPADLAKTTDGGFAIKQRKEEMKDIGKWITLEKSEITLPPKTSQKITFTLSVPNDPKLDVGEHAGGIAVEEKAKTTFTKQEGIIMHKRIGVRVYVTLPGEIVKNIEYKSFKKTISEFRSFIIPKIYQFSAAFDNTGNVSNTVELTFKAKNLITREVFTQKFNQLLTRETKGVSNFTWKAPFFGIYQFKIEGIYQTNDNTGSFETNTLTGIIIPWDFVILVLALGIILNKTIKSHKKKYSGEGWTKYTIKKTDTLELLAKKHSVTWKQIAKVNKINPPYTLKNGAQILTPKISKTKSQK